MKGTQIKGLTREALDELYFNNPEGTLESVAQHFGCHREAIRREIGRLGLKTKAKSRPGRTKKGHDARLADAEWLRVSLADKTAKQLATELGCSEQVVTYWAHKHGILDRDKSRNVSNGLAKRYPEGRMAEQAANWRGGRNATAAGYIKVYASDHPAAHGGSVFEHRLVMERIIGRYLEPDEVVHHLDGNRQNNAPENLSLLKRGEHVSGHFKVSHEVLALRKRVAELENKVGSMLSRAQAAEQELERLRTALRAIIGVENTAPFTEYMCGVNGIGCAYDKVQELARQVLAESGG